MATVLTKPQATRAKVEAQLSHELAQATSRIRFADLLAGGLTLVVLLLGYTLAVVLADKLLELPAWVRVAGLLGFLTAFGVAAWRTVVRPLRSRVNPRFAARQVEQTIADGKNAVINWVDLKDRDLPESVRAAVGARAAEGVAEAEVARVGESRRVLALLSAAGLLVAGLAVFFLLVKSAPFFSLLSRAYNPFGATGIATRTTIAVEEPAGGDATVTSGDPLTVRVTLGGTVPDAKSPDRARLLVRYNPEAEEFEEVFLEQAGSKREFAAKLPPSVVQNGFRYRVAAGDGRTPEFAVTVRTRPLLRDFTVRYEYPAYTRLLPEVTADPRVEGYRGTAVTLTARANRGVKDARLVFDTQLTQVPGTVSADTPDAVTFRFNLDESCNYRIAWTAADGEGADCAAYPVRVLADQPPAVTITPPRDEETALPADGLLKVDGVAADDFGLTALTLRLRVAGTPGVALEGKKYRDGKPFPKAAGQGDPTAVEYKDSVKLSTLKSKSGEAVKLDPGAVVEYWLEAADNCQPAANVGRSKVQRVTISPPPQPAEQKPQQERQQRDQTERQQQEQQHNAKQDDQLQKEQRPPQQPRPESVEKQPGEPEPKPGEGNEGQPKPGQSKPADAQPGEPKPGGGQNATTPPQEAPKPGKASNPPESKPNATQEPNPGQAPMTQPPEGGSKVNPSTKTDGGGKPNETPKSEPSGKQDQPRDAELQQQAEKVQRALDQQRQGGEARPPETNPPADRQQPMKPGDEHPGNAKPQGGNAQQPKPAGEPKPTPGDPPAEGAAPSEPKPQGSEPKPQGGEPKPQGGEKGQPESSQPKPADGDKGGQAGEPKPQPAAESKPGEGGQPGEPKSGQEKGTFEGANEKPQGGKPGTGSKAEPKKGDQAGEGRGEGDPQSGTKSDPGVPKGEAKPRRGDEPAPGEAREKPTPGEEPGDSTKPAPGGAPKAGDPGQGKKQAGDGGKSGEPKPTGGGEPKAGPKSIDAKKPGSDPNGKPPAGAEKVTEKSSGGSAKKPDARELEEAVKDLKSGDPAKEQAAREKLDQTFGKENQAAAEKKAEQLERDLKSNDPATQAAARKEIEQIAEQAKKNGAGDQPTETPQGDAGKKPTPEQVKAAEQLAKDLTSKDDATREAAERKVDQAVGRGEREKLQRDLQDAQSGDPKKAADAKQRLDERAKGKPGKDDLKPRGPGDYTDEPGEKLKVDPKNRKKTADLQLKTFDKAKADKEFLKKLGYTPEQYDEFLKGYRDMLARQQAEAAKPELLPAPGEAGPATIRVAEGGAKPLDKKPGDGANTAGAGVGTAPPGFSEAQRKFAEEAAKLRRPDPKK